ncbi:hypothetical protein FQN54_001835 [Arachnomyces sp. PD_36]|nr:hypothetical protein FQN54_001835 [Arachnomyces sp. PD_36]
MAQESPTPEQLLREAVIFGSIGFVLYVGRMWSRILVGGGIKRLLPDDYIMTLTFLVYVAMLVLIQISSRHATNLMDPADYEKVLADPEEVKSRIYGSKIVIGLEQCMLFSTWGVKTCLLLLYHKMTLGVRQNLFVKILAGYALLGFVVIMVTYYGVYCRPFSQYWAMPVENMQCATYQHYSITQAVFNISSDAFMLMVPIPLIIRAQIRLRKKLLLCAVFSLGIFVIVAAILNKYFNFAAPLTITYQIWYIREASTAIYVANMMCWWPLLRKIFGFGAFQYNYHTGGRYQSRPISGALQLSNIDQQGKNIDSDVSGSDDNSRLSFIKKRMFRNSGATNMSKSRNTHTSSTVMTSRTSQEAFNVPEPVPISQHQSRADGEDGAPLEIWHRVDYDVEENAESPKAAPAASSIHDSQDTYDMEWPNEPQIAGPTSYQAAVTTTKP